MKVCKPLKVPVLTRVFPTHGVARLHVTTILAFPLVSPRALLDEIALWPKLTELLGPVAIDEGLAKPRGEFLVAGSCVVSDGRPVIESFVRVRVGQVERRLAVIGERVWSGGTPTKPAPFLERSIDWSQAFGGPGYGANPLGRGLASVDVSGRSVVPLPTVERVDERIASPSDRPSPACFLPMDFAFASRRAQAGTFDESYVRDHAPGLPPDHAPSVFNLAQPEQWAASAWRGDERFAVENMSRETKLLEGTLPGLVTRAFVERSAPEGPRFLEIALAYDTVWLLPTAGLGLVIAHGTTEVADLDARDVTALVAACETPEARRSLDHYRDSLARRRDKDRGALHDLSDSDLMPPRESGVAPNIDLGEMGQWQKREEHQRLRVHNGAIRRRRRAREQLLAEGKDPAAFGLAEDLSPLAPHPDPGDFDAVARRMEENFIRVEAAKRDAAKRAAAEAAEGRAALQRAGKTRPMEDEPDGGSGPPGYRASEHLARLSRQAASARRTGAPLVDLEAQLANPSFRGRLEELERVAREGYRVGAHHLPAAAPMTEAANQMSRVVVELAREVSESLARRDLTGVALAGMDLRGLDLREALLEGADLRGADLAGAVLDGAVLARADLAGASLSGARLAKANLGLANLTGADLSDAVLTEAILMGADTSNARFRGANLSGANISKTSLEGVDLEGVSLFRTTLLQVNLSKANLSEANLEFATLLECTLDETRFDRASFARASILGCRGQRASFRGVKARESVITHSTELPSADFRGADLERCCMRATRFEDARFDAARMAMADLSECHARGARFDRADMRNALMIRCELTGASLQGVNLVEALLTQAKLAGADLTGSQLVRADLIGASGDERTSFREAITTWARFNDSSKKAARR